jgi:hypothetical protein
MLVVCETKAGFTGSRTGRVEAGSSLAPISARPADARAAPSAFSGRECSRDDFDEEPCLTFARRTLALVDGSSEDKSGVFLRSGIKNVPNRLLRTLRRDRKQCMDLLGRGARAET